MFRAADRIRAVLVVGALAFSGFILVNAFEDLDPAAIADALWSLDDADRIALGAMWLLWIGAQGLQTASLIPGLPVRRGVIAILGPAAVASVIPGPSDLPVRYRMLTSGGRDRAEATLAVGAGGLFSIGIELVLPAIAAIGLVISDARLTEPCGRSWLSPSSSDSALRRSGWCSARPAAPRRSAVSSIRCGGWSCG